MNIPHFHRAVALSLVAVFTLFSVGVPVVKYLCPMMGPDKPTCECSAQKTAEPAFVYQGGDCCGSYLIAERNTTPFLNPENLSTWKIAALHVLSVTSWEIPGPAFSSVYTSAPSASSSPPTERLFLRNSTLLI